LSQLWLDTTHDPWRISCWCLKHCWSPILTLQLSCTFLPLTRHGLRDHTSSSHAVSRATGLRFRRFRKSSENAVADQFRGWPPRGVHALLAPPRRAPCSLMKASASLTLFSSRHFPLYHPPPCERGDREDHDRRRAKSPKPSVIVRFP